MKFYALHVQSLLFGASAGLFPVLIVLVVVGLALVAFKGAFTKQADDKPLNLELKAKRYFFTQAERAFYTLLTESLQGAPFTVFSKVRLNDIIEATGEQRQATNNRINRMHADFLVLSQLDYKPLLVIELDGASHNSASQAARDAKKDAALRAAGITLLRLPNNTTRQQLLGALEPHLELGVWSGTRGTGTRARSAVKN